MNASVAARYIYEDIHHNGNIQDERQINHFLGIEAILHF
jgi:hypothetical protein